MARDFVDENGKKRTKKLEQHLHVEGKKPNHPRAIESLMVNSRVYYFFSNGL